MLRCFTTLAALSLIIGAAQAQNPDTVHVLGQVVVQGYAANRPLSEVPASIGILDSQKLQRFSNTSILPAINTIPGVRMEERSPGSYRFAIRGSSLRSPFGVRNVKVYWNGLPLTDGGGNTYLNLLDFNAVGAVEVIKGPGSSLYGAGTGGVVMLNSPTISKKQIDFTASSGGYGLHRYQLALQTGNDKSSFAVRYAHQVAEGYRQQSAMRRDAININMQTTLGEKSSIKGNLLYSDLFYETPGGLTQSEFSTNQQLARPDTKAFRGSVTQHAAIYNKTLFGGLMSDYDWSNHWSTKAGIYGSHTSFINPAIRNYEVRSENNWGGRTETQYKTFHEQWKGKLTFGAEYQYFHSPLTDYGNRAGVRDTLQFADRLGSTQTVAFAQMEFDLPHSFFVTLGGSTTFLQYRFIRTAGPQTSELQTRNFTPVVSPRLAVLKKLNTNISVFASLSQGFSTPSLAEVRPSSNLYNNTLGPESGRNYEAGIRGSFLGDKLSFEVSCYRFELNQTIVTPDGGDHYTNSGKTSQPGLESGFGYTPVLRGQGVVSFLKLWTNYTYNPYHFRNYLVGTADYSGNKLTGVAQNTIVSGADLSLRNGLYANVTFTHTSAIPLNDANSATTKSCDLFGARAGYRISAITSFKLELFSGVDNAFSAHYSLGNDLNATGGRYYNAAALRNFYVSLKGTF